MTEPLYPLEKHLHEDFVSSIQEYDTATSGNIQPANRLSRDAEAVYEQLEISNVKACAYGHDQMCRSLKAAGIRSALPVREELLRSRFLARATARLVSQRLEGAKLWHQAPHCPGELTSDQGHGSELLQQMELYICVLSMVAKVCFCNAKMNIYLVYKLCVR